jgi:hypothetical protein
MAAAKKRVIKATGKKPISFKPGGLHQSLGVPQGKPIPPGKMRDALAGNAGPKARAQAEFAKNVLTGPKKTTRKTAPKGK